MIVFFKEDIRLFAWIMLSFFGGNLIRFYVDKFLEGLELQAFNELIFSQLLLIIPILSVTYVIKAFNREISSFLQKLSLNSVKKELSILLIAFLMVFIMIVITDDVQNTMKLFLSLLLFTSLHAALQEWIWRGILLTHFIKITNERYGILIISLAFGINSTLLGFSTFFFIIYSLLGSFFAFLTIKTKSIFPATIVHIIVLFFFYLIGMLHIPIL